MRVGNPLLRPDMFVGRLAVDEDDAGGAMTATGVFTKTALLTWLMALSFTWTWLRASDSPKIAAALAGAGMLSAIIFGCITMLRRPWAPMTSPIYALSEGLMLGGISAYYAGKSPGLAGIALVGTITVLVSMLWVYRSKLMPYGAQMRIVMASIIGGAFLLYLVTFAIKPLELGVPVLVFGSPSGIVLCMLLIALAALNLFYSFEAFAGEEELSAPSYMEWYAGFGLLVTLVWMYVSVVKLLPIHLHGKSQE